VSDSSVHALDRALISVRPAACLRAFYIYTIITDDAYSNSILRLTESTSFHRTSFIFTIFVYVARQVELTGWRTVSQGMEMTLLPLPISGTTSSAAASPARAAS
jgi:hypothetical protein